MVRPGGVEVPELYEHQRSLDHRLPQKITFLPLAPDGPTLLQPVGHNWALCVERDIAGCNYGYNIPSPVRPMTDLVGKVGERTIEISLSPAVPQYRAPKIYISKYQWAPPLMIYISEHYPSSSRLFHHMTSRQRTLAL